MSEALGRYELLRVLGRGGMAEVYLARRRVAGLEKRLVVKRIRRERAGDPALLELFMREARLSMSLGHQNVVPVFDFGRDGDDAFLAMEYVDGRDLGSCLARATGPLPPLLAAYVARECCRALDHAHHRRAPDGAAAGVIHRDVTPRNVLLSWAGEVKLADFGVATPAAGGDVTIRGTWAYMAPEQARGEAIDGRADLYALGLVLWAMLAGARPRPGDDADALRAQARDGALPALPPAPDALREVLVRATAADREARYPDARTMQDALDAYLVTAQAEQPGPAPDRQLADWLTSLWGDDARRAETDDDAVEILAADRTQRSLAATVGDEAPAPTPAPTEPPLATGSTPGEVPQARGGRWRMLTGVGLATAATATLALVLLQRPADEATAPSTARGGPPTATGPTATGPTTTGATATGPTATGATATGATATGPTGPATIGPAPPSASTAVPPAMGTTAPTAPTTPRAGRGDGGRGAPRPVDEARRPADATPAGTDGAPRVATRRVTLNVVPWADFTVDADPTPHQTPETLSLPPGPHRFHLRNPTLGIERTITLDVPADRDLRHVERLEPR